MAKYNVKKPFKYGMATRKEDWKSIDGQLEKQYVIVSFDIPIYNK